MKNPRVISQFSNLSFLPIQQRRALAACNDEPPLADIPSNIITVPNRLHLIPQLGSSRWARERQPKIIHHNRRARTGRWHLKGAYIDTPAHSEQSQSATAGSGDGIREADSALSAAGGDCESEKGPDSVSSVRTRDLDDFCWGQGGCWEVFLDQDAD